MTTYNSYEAAKIANPEDEIYKIGNSFMGEEAKNLGFPWIEQIKKCNPADHCITYNCCKEFKSGMIVMESSRVLRVDDARADFLNKMKGCVTDKKNWDKCYILNPLALSNPFDDGSVEHITCEITADRIGNALEGLISAYDIKEQPKRVKVDYVKVEDSIFDLRPYFEAGELYFRWLGNGEEGSGGVGYDKITTESMLLCRYEEGRLLRRIETEITERDEFIEAMSAILPVFDKRTIPSWIGRIYDSGKFKLVEGE